jgi:GT2 family glycosyltransferase
VNGQGAVPALSVVIPTFNAEKYLAEAVASVLAQDFGDFELLIVDDGSTDGTSAILQSLADDPRLKLLRNNRNMGLIATLHHAYAQCSAPLIARMDADDICDPARLGRQVAFLQANPEVAIVGGAIRFFGNIAPNQFHFPTHHEAIRVAMLFYCPLAHPALMFRRELVDQGLMQYDDAFRHAEDYHLWSRLLLKVKAANLDDVVLNYRLHAQQVSSDSSDKQYAASLRVRRQMLDECGVVADEEEIALHESVILERPLPVAGYMTKLAAWFLRLERANSESGYWDATALHSLLRGKFLETAQRTETSLFQLASDPTSGHYVSHGDVGQPNQRLLTRIKRRVKALLWRLSTKIGRS